MQELDVKASILQHIAMIKPWVPRQAIISVGEYASQIVLKKPIQDSTTCTYFIEKADEKTPKFRQNSIDAANILGIDPKVDAHYWFNVKQALTKDNALIEKAKAKCSGKLDQAIIVASVGEGASSALLPELAEKIKEWNVSAVAFSILPSTVQPPDAYFNALYAMAEGSSKNLTQVIIDRDNLESYIGVDRKGTVLSGNNVLNYVLELMLAKEQFIQELGELSRPFNIKFFTILAATGASFKVHGGLQNILNVALLRPLIDMPLTDATVLYVLPRISSTLKEQLPKGKIELTVVDWFKDKANLKSVYVSEPIYMDDGSDRLDIIMFLGGFSIAKRVAAANKKIQDIKNYAAKNGVKKEEWEELISSLTA